MKRVAIVGFGFMGITHALNIIKNQKLELVAIVEKNLDDIENKLSTVVGNISYGDIDPDAINRLIKYTSLEACIKSEHIDAVHICVHTDLHYEMTKIALNAGLHVFLEKPFCLNISQGEELISLAKEKGLILMVGHVVRFMTPYQKLKEWIVSGEYGRLKFLSLSRFSGVPHWGQWKEKQANFGSSGGGLFDFVIHDIDYALYILGGAPASIESNNQPGQLSKHDYIDATWNYPDKSAIVKIEGGNIFHAHFPFRASFTAQFENASVFFSTSDPEFIIISDDNDSYEIPVDELSKGYYDETDYFADCLKSNSKPLKCMPNSSLETIRISYLHLNDHKDKTLK